MFAELAGVSVLVGHLMHGLAERRVGRAPDQRRFARLETVAVDLLGGGRAEPGDGRADGQQQGPEQSGVLHAFPLLPGGPTLPPFPARWPDRRGRGFTTGAARARRAISFPASGGVSPLL